jgi:hypothetical protein
LTRHAAFPANFFTELGAVRREPAR